jgi:hypothetical protein
MNHDRPNPGAAARRTRDEIDIAARDRQAREQTELIDWMCLKTGLSISALAKEAGMSNTTITRYRQLGRPNKPETVERLARACSKILTAQSLALNTETDEPRGPR